MEKIPCLETVMIYQMAYLLYTYECLNGNTPALGKQLLCDRAVSIL